jgi:hypothetical protein
MIGRQRERLERSAELRAPVGHQLAESCTGELFALPDGEVGVLERQLLKLATGIRGGQLIEQHRTRPSIERDVVRLDQQDVIVRRKPNERAAEHMLVREIERHTATLADDALGVCFTRGVDQLYSNRRRRIDHLLRLTILPRKARPQNLMPRDNRRDRALQRRHVERTREPPRHRHVVRRQTGRRPVEHPDQFLRERQRDAIRPSAHFDRRRIRRDVGALLGEQCVEELEVVVVVQCAGHIVESVGHERSGVVAGERVAASLARSSALIPRSLSTARATVVV